MLKYPYQNKVTSIKPITLTMLGSKQMFVDTDEVGILKQ